MTTPLLCPPDVAYRLLEQGLAPNGLTVPGELDYSARSERPLPDAFPCHMTVGYLNVAGSTLRKLSADLHVQELDASGTLLEQLPDGLQVRTRLNLAGCDRLERLPDGLRVGTLNVAGCTALEALPEGLDVWFLDLSSCWAFETWPHQAVIRGGRLQLRGCTALRELPPYVRRLSALNVRDCPNLTTLPADLVVTGWLDLAHSGLTSEAQLPVGLASTQLRWAGVNIDRRIAFHPELISIDEILNERNAERRRVLLDRFGYSRFLTEAAAEVLSTDTDPGGPRQLLRVGLPDDEPLVAMSCFCPSTGRQYMIRVPPATQTCHQAAAWIAGFDNPDDYRPLIET